MKILVLAIVGLVIFFVGAGGVVWWKVQSDYYDKGVMDGD